MAGATDNLDTRILFGRLSADSPVLTSWPKLWVGVLIGGIITGLLVWLVGGWWYRMRMHLSGGRDINKRKARIVYMHANLVLGVPAVAWLVIVTSCCPKTQPTDI